MSAAPRSTRLTGLDGLRGIAAVVVLLYHLSLVARPFIDTGTPGDTWWWLTHTPLKLFTAGTEAVLVFFVLSGLVVTLPALRAGFGWLGYFGARAVRLYLPVWGSLALAALLIALLPRDVAAVTTDSWLVRASAETLHLPQLLQEASLWKATYDVNNVLWSLRWELVFSLSLPLFVIVGRAVRDHWALAGSLAVVVSITGRLVDLDALVYLPVFFLGVLVAVNLESFRDAVAGWRTRTWTLLATGSGVVLIASWLARPIEGAIGGDVLWGLSAVGAIGLVLVVVGSRGADRALSAPAPRWLGRISFSLYLVQAPIIGTLGFAFGDEQWALVALVGVPLTVLVAWGFFHVVERPSHRLAKAVARRLSGQKPRAQSEPQLESAERMLPAGSVNHTMSGP